MTEKPDKYEKLMLEYYKILNNSWKKEIKEAAKEAIRALITIKEQNLIDSLDELIALATQNLCEDFQAELTKPTRAFVETVYRLKTMDVMQETGFNFGVGIYGLPQKSAAVKYANQNLFWIGKHFGGEVSERFKTKLADALNSGSSKREFADVLKNEFTDLGRSPKYWLGLAENAEIRTKELAASDAYQRLGIKELEIVAIMDNRTTDICREMNGRIIPVSDMVHIRDRLMSINTDGMSTDDVKSQMHSIVPFWNDADTQTIMGKSTSDIISKHPGLAMPPFHWRCRTRTAPVISSTNITIKRGENPLTLKDKNFNNLSRREIANKLASIKNKRFYDYDEDDFLDDKDKHGRDEFGVNPAEYKMLAQKIVNSADRVLARTYKGQLQFEFYSFEKNGYTVLDTNGVIRGCFGHQKQDGIVSCFQNKKEKAYELTN